MPWWALAMLMLGANFALWGSVGLIRLAESVLTRGGGPPDPPDRRSAWRANPGGPLTTTDVAVLIPAHNEELVIADSLRAIMALVPPRNVHVVSDGSTDGTVQIARRSGARVISTQENVGKAGALEEAIARFGLIDRFAVVMLLDADTRVQPGYFAAALPMFDNPQVVAVAGCVRTARDRKLSLSGQVLVGHRTRIYAIGQRALKFGQTWLRSNATPIVPGFASLYRTRVLPHLEMNPPGLVIEDFNMTFEVYQKRLGKVGFTLSAVAVTQDPDNLHDYIRQTKRWALGLWQTVRRHPPRANLFTAMIALLLLELVTSSVLFFLLPLALIVLLVPDLAGQVLSWPPFDDLHLAVSSHLTLTAVLLGVLLPDFLLTCAVAVLERQPRLLPLAVFFPFMRILDAAISLYSVPMAWLSVSNGRWKSPARRPVGSAAAAALPAAGPRQAACHALGPAMSRAGRRGWRRQVMYLGEDGPVATVHSELMDPVRILLVDDHLMVTEALASRLSAAMDLWVAGRCTTADPNLLDIVRGLRPDVITIEVEPLGPAAGQVLQGLVTARPEAKVVVLSADHNIAHAVEAARAGVAAWVAKEQGAAELETVVRGVCQGYSWFPPDMLGAILRELRADVSRAREHDDLLDVLSPRERDVLLSMMDGKRGRQIAQDLLISTDTVRTHTRNIFAKLDVHSRLEAVRVARAAGLRRPETG